MDVFCWLITLFRTFFLRFILMCFLSCYIGCYLNFADINFFVKFWLIWNLIKNRWNSYKVHMAQFQFQSPIVCSGFSFDAIWICFEFFEKNLTHSTNYENWSFLSFYSSFLSFKKFFLFIVLSRKKKKNKAFPFCKCSFCTIDWSRSRNPSKGDAKRREIASSDSNYFHLVSTTKSWALAKNFFLKAFKGPESLSNQVIILKF